MDWAEISIDISAPPSAPPAPFSAPAAPSLDCVAARGMLEELCSTKVSVLPCVAVCCSVLQCATVCCSVLQYVTVCCCVLQCFAMCCSVLQCAAACVAVCCSVLQCVAYTCVHHGQGQLEVDRCSLRQLAMSARDIALYDAQDIVRENTLDQYMTISRAHNASS